MSVKIAEKTDRIKIRHPLALTDLQEKHKQPRTPKTARLKIINGRPYYYEVVNVWDRKEQRCHQKSKYLGKELPKGYRLIK